MKVKLYKKWLNYTMRHWCEGNNQKEYLSKEARELSYDANSVNINTKYYDLNLYRLQVGFECWKNLDKLSVVTDFKHKYMKYSRKYWTDEAKLRRMIMTGREID